MSNMTGADATDGVPPKRARQGWADAAAEDFCDGAGAPEIVGTTSAKPHRDVKSWVVGLLEVKHARRFQRLAEEASIAAARKRAAEARQKERAGTEKEREEREEAGRARVKLAGAGRALAEQAERAARPVGATGIDADAEDAAALRSMGVVGNVVGNWTGVADKCDEPAAELTWSIMMRTITYHQGGSDKIAAMSARRQCARKPGSLSLVMIVEVALALCSLKQISTSLMLRETSPTASASATSAAVVALERAIAALRALKCVHTVDEASKRMHALVMDQRWLEAYSQGRGSSAFWVVREVALVADSKVMPSLWEPVLRELAQVRDRPGRAAADTLYELGCLKLDESAEDAYSLFKSAAALGNPLAPNNAGMLSFVRGDFEHALLAFEQGGTRGDHRAAWHAAVVCLEVLERPAQGMVWLERAVALGNRTAPVFLAKWLSQDNRGGG